MTRLPEVKPEEFFDERPREMTIEEIRDFLKKKEEEEVQAFMDDIEAVCRKHKRDLVPKQVVTMEIVKREG